VKAHESLAVLFELGLIRMRLLPGTAVVVRQQSGHSFDLVRGRITRVLHDRPRFLMAEDDRDQLVRVMLDRKSFVESFEELDLADPATRGIVLELLREAIADTTVSLVPHLDSDGVHAGWDCCGRGFVFRGPFEAFVLEATLAWTVERARSHRLRPKAD
jgi:hypothetical protein